MKKMYKKPVVEEIVSPAEAVLLGVSGSGAGGETPVKGVNNDTHISGSGSRAPKHVYF